MSGDSDLVRRLEASRRALAEARQAVEALERQADRMAWSTTLSCAECGEDSDAFAVGWRALLTAEEDGSESVAVFCPNCAGEFDDAC
jgi:hypothetical protein